jgi:hypothetical protein
MELGGQNICPTTFAPHVWHLRGKFAPFTPPSKQALCKSLVNQQLPVTCSYQMPPLISNTTAIVISPFLLAKHTDSLFLAHFVHFGSCTFFSKSGHELKAKRCQVRFLRQHPSKQMRDAGRREWHVPCSVHDT